MRLLPRLLFALLIATLAGISPALAQHCNLANQEADFDTDHFELGPAVDGFAGFQAAGCADDSTVRYGVWNKTTGERAVASGVIDYSGTPDTLGYTEITTSTGSPLVFTPGDEIEVGDTFTAQEFDAKLDNVVEDTTPQLGGDLDLLGQTIFDSALTESPRLLMADIGVFRQEVIDFQAIFEQFSNMGTPAAGGIGAWYGYGVDSGTNVTFFGGIDINSTDVTNGSEDASLVVALKSSGADLSALTLGAHGVGGFSQFSSVVDLGSESFPIFWVKNTASNAGGPVMFLYADSTSPALGDLAGQYTFVANNDNDEPAYYGSIYTEIVDPTEDAQVGKMVFELAGGTSGSNFLDIQAMTLDGSKLTAGETNYQPRISLNADTTWYVGAAPETVTISNASPGVVSWTSHGLAVGDAVRFSTTGALPTGLKRGELYFIISAGFGANSFQISREVGGSAINTSSAGSGTHSAVAGNDAWDGLDDVKGKAWATPQRAWNHIIENVDLTGYTATIKFADGWYDFVNDNESPGYRWAGCTPYCENQYTDGTWYGTDSGYVSLNGSLPTGGIVKFAGNPADKTDVVLTQTANIWSTIEINYSGGGQLVFDDITLRSDCCDNWGTTIGAYQNGLLMFWSVEFQNGQAQATSVIDASSPSGNLVFSADFSINMSTEFWSGFMQVNQGMSAGFGNRDDEAGGGVGEGIGPLTIAVSGSPTFHGGLFFPGTGSVVNIQPPTTAPTPGTEITGSWTGPDYIIDRGGQLGAHGTGNDLDWMPGSQAPQFRAGSVAWIGDLGATIEGLTVVDDDTNGSEDTHRSFEVMAGGSIVTAAALYGPEAGLRLYSGSDYGGIRIAGNYVRIEGHEGGTLQIGDNSDATNYYDNTAHVFRSRDSGTGFASLTEGALTLINNDDAASGPNITFDHNDPSADASDYPGVIQVNAGADGERIGFVAMRIVDPATTTEDTAWEIMSRVAGSDVVMASIGEAHTDLTSPVSTTVGSYFLCGTTNGCHFDFVSESQGVNGAILNLYGNSGNSAATNDIPGTIQVWGRASNSTQQLYSIIETVASDVTSGNEDAYIDFEVVSSGSFSTPLLRIGSTSGAAWNISPAGDLLVGTNGAYDIGVSGTGIDDLFFASGSIIDWNAGDCTITHTATNFIGAGGGCSWVWGHTASIAMQNGTSPIQVIATDNTASITINRYNASGLAPRLIFGHSDSDSIGTHAAVPADDDLGHIMAEGSNGTSFTAGGQISFVADAAWGSAGDTTDAPTRIMLKTAPDGSSLLANRFTVTSNGGVIIGDGVVSPGAEDLSLEGGDIEFGNAGSAASNTTLSHSGTAGELNLEGDRVKHAGEQSFFISAIGFRGEVVNPAGSFLLDVGTNNLTMHGWAFDPGATEEIIGIQLAMPKSWNTTSLAFTPYSHCPSGCSASQTIQFEFSCVAISHDDVIDAGTGSTVTSSVTIPATTDLLIGAKTSPVACAGSPADGDLIYIRISRDTSVDSGAGDAVFLGATVFWFDDQATMAE